MREPTFNKTIQDHFQAHHIRLVWMELKTRFGFNINLWNKRFERALANKGKDCDEAGFFLFFGNQYINILLNQILCRPDYHPTFNNMVTWILNNQLKIHKKSLN